MCALCRIYLVITCMLIANEIKWLGLSKGNLVLRVLLFNVSS